VSCHHRLVRSRQHAGLAACLIPVVGTFRITGMREGLCKILRAR
jgi:hypothetical protein